MDPQCSGRRLRIAGTPRPFAARGGRGIRPAAAAGCARRCGWSPGALEFELAFETWGTLDSDAANAVLVEHALTGDSHAAGAAEPGHPPGGWWGGLIGPGRALDPDELAVVVPKRARRLPGYDRPVLARAGREAVGEPISGRHRAGPGRLGDGAGRHARNRTVGVGVRRFDGRDAGARMGVSLPPRVDTLLALAAPAASPAGQIAWVSPQLQAIRADPGWCGGDYYAGVPGAGPHLGLGVARRIAHVTYRSEPELAQRFGRRPQRDGRFAVESYLDHHADELVRRFDANSYLVLTESMNTHDVGRDRAASARHSTA